MSTSAKIRDLSAKGPSNPEIARKLGVSRQAVYAALKRQDRGVARDQGKHGCKISVWLTEELCEALERATRKNETKSDCVVRLLKKGLGRR